MMNWKMNPYINMTMLVEQMNGHLSHKLWRGGKYNLTQLWKNIAHNFHQIARDAYMFNTY